MTSTRHAPTSQYDRRWWMGIFALFLVIAFQLVNVHALYLHEDEELSYRSTEGDIAFAINFQTSLQDNQAPGWFVTFAAWRALVSDSEFAARILSLLLSSLSVAITFKLGRRWFGAWGGAFALIVLIGNGLFFQYAYDIRPYPMVMLVTAISFWAFDNWMRTNTIRRAVIYGLSIALMLYVHYLLVFAVFAQAIYCVFAYKLTLRRIGYGFAAGATAAILFAPWFPVFVAQVQHLRNIEAQSGTGRGAAGIGVSTQATTPDTVLHLLNFATNGLIVVYGGVLVIGLIVLWRRRSYWLALTWGILSPTIYLLANTVAAVYAPRFVSYMMLGIALALGAAINAMPLPETWRRIPIRGAIVAGFVALNLLTFPSMLPVRIPYRDLFREMSTESQAGDVVLFVRGEENNGFVQHLYRQWMAPELVANITTDVDAAANARRIWYATADFFHEDVGTAFNRLEPTHPVQQVIGKCDRAWCYVIQLMEAPPSADAQVFGSALSFYGADIERVSPYQLDVRLWWRADAPVPLDYSIGVQLMDTAGALIAQSDGAINHYGSEVVQTSQMDPGQIYIDYRSLTLPEDSPPGTYQLGLVVYQSWDGNRLMLPGGANWLLLDELLVSE